MLRAEHAVAVRLAVAVVLGADERRATARGAAVRAQPPLWRPRLLLN